MTPTTAAWRQLLLSLLLLVLVRNSSSLSKKTKKIIRDEVKEMFYHAYNNYMDNAYPADELMPLSCKGRYRGTLPSRGDVDDILGNFSMTLVDSFDTLVIMGDIEEFERAVRLVIKDVTFDRDIVVSVFETNIRMLGGLLSGHVLADNLRRRNKGLSWYRTELLDMAKELGYRILPAFNTSTGIPFPRVNLRHGVKQEMARTGHEKDTCTACAGTMLLEFAALSRLTGEPIFEAKAHRAMDSLWQYRHRTSNLVGTVINIHNGEWVRRDAGIGAGIDSYYEYLLKAYILLGDDTYLDRFNLHYESIMKYVNQGPMMVDVHMHRPHSNSKNFMDSLFAFWPGLQVLKGDIKPAIEIHEMLYQVMQRHNFLPEAFTTDFRVHWGQHPLRPEFVESTYFLYRATGDPHYLDVGKKVIDNLNAHARVNCGYAAIKDVTTGKHEDQMESFVMSETFKYLYLLFSDDEDLLINIDDFVFTTEAHLLPLTLSLHEKSNRNITLSDSAILYSNEASTSEPREDDPDRTCPNSAHIFKNNANYAHNLRSPLRNMVENVCPKPGGGSSRKHNRLQAREFMAGNVDQVGQLKNMGIRIVTMSDGRVQLLHTASEALSTEDAEDGMMFMQEMIELSKTQATVMQQENRVVQLLSAPHFGGMVYSAGAAQFGYNLHVHPGIKGGVALAEPETACTALTNPEFVAGKFAIVSRGSCMFVDKARNLEAAGAIGGIVIDTTVGSSSATSPVFAMSGDGKDDLSSPMVFLFHKEGGLLKESLADNPDLYIFIGKEKLSPDHVMRDLLLQHSGPAQADNERRCTTPGEPALAENIVVTIKPLEALFDAERGLLPTSGTWHTSEGQVMFRIIHRQHDQKLEFQLGEQAFFDKLKMKRSTLIEQVVQLIQDNQKFTNMDLKGQSDYLFSVGKLLDSSVSENSEIILEQRLKTRLDQDLHLTFTNVLNTLAILTVKDLQGQQHRDLLRKTVDSIIEVYIQESLDLVYNKAKKVLESNSLGDLLQTTSSEKSSFKNINLDIEETSQENSDVVKATDFEDSITTKVRFETYDGKTRYASFVNLDVAGNTMKSAQRKISINMEDLRDAYSDTMERNRNPSQNWIRKPPSWMILKEDEIFVDSNGVMFANFGVDNDERNSGKESKKFQEMGDKTDQESIVDSVHIDKKVVHKVENEIKYGSMKSAGQTNDHSDHDSFQSSPSHSHHPQSSTDSNNDHDSYSSSSPLSDENSQPTTKTADTDIPSVEFIQNYKEKTKSKHFTIRNVKSTHTVSEDEENQRSINEEKHLEESMDSLNKILNDLQIGDSFNMDSNGNIDAIHKQQYSDENEQNRLNDMLENLNKIISSPHEKTGEKNGEDNNVDKRLGDETEIFDDDDNIGDYRNDENQPTFTDSIAQNDDISTENDDVNDDL